MNSDGNSSGRFYPGRAGERVSQAAAEATAAPGNHLVTVADALALSKGLFEVGLVSGPPFHLFGVRVLLLVRLPSGTDKTSFIAVLKTKGVPAELVRVAEGAFLTSLGCPVLKFDLGTKGLAEEFLDKVRPVLRRELLSG